MLLEKLLNRVNFLRSLLRFGNEKAIWRAVLLLLLAIAVLGVLVDLKNTAKFGQFDLRNRVVGARVMLLGHNPYTYRWHPGEPTTLLDPFIGATGSVSGVTVTPTVLSIHALFAKLHYRYQKFLWFLAQMALFGGIVWLAMLRAENLETRAVVFLFGLMFYCATFWRMHVDRGQVYVLYYFLTALYISSFKWRTVYRGALGGFVFGVLVCLRPHLAVLGIPLFLYRKWDCVLSAMVGAAVGLLCPMMVSPTVWFDFLHAMMNYVQVPGKSVGAATILSPGFELPAEVEGFSNLATFAKFGDADTSLKATLTYLHIPSSTRLFFVLLATGMGAWFIYVYRMMRRNVPLDFCTSKTLALVLFIEIVLPIRRGEYSNMILVPIVLMIFATGSRIGALRVWEWVLILSAWILSAPFPPWVSVGFRGLDIGVVGPYAIVLWAWFTPWRLPATNADADDNPSSNLLPGEANRPPQVAI